jgi:hypothetical protein
MLTKIIWSLKEFAFGFLGWFIFANIVFGVIVLIMIGLPFIDGLPLVVIGIWLPTAIALINLLLRKRFGNAMGMLAGVTVNTILIGIFFGTSLRMFSGQFSDALLLLPLPTMYFTMFLVVVNFSFPPYTVNSLTNLFFVR